MLIFLESDVSQLALSCHFNTQTWLRKEDRRVPLSTVAGGCWPQKPRWSTCEEDAVTRRRTELIGDNVSKRQVETED